MIVLEYPVVLVMLIRVEFVMVANQILQIVQRVEMMLIPLLMAHRAIIIPLIVQVNVMVLLLKIIVENAMVIIDHVVVIMELNYPMERVIVTLDGVGGHVEVQETRVMIAVAVIMLIRGVGAMRQHQ